MEDRKAALLEPHELINLEVLGTKYNENTSMFAFTMVYKEME